MPMATSESRSKTSSDLEQFASRYDLRQVVLQWAQIDVAHSRYALCPFPSHVHSGKGTPSFSVVRGGQYFKCFACGASGDVIDFVGYMLIADYNGKNKEHLARAMNALQYGSEQAPEPIARPVIQRELINPHIAEEQFLRGKTCQPVLDYAQGRGLTAAIVPYKLGASWDRRVSRWRLTIPAYDQDGVLQAIKMRLVDRDRTGKRILSAEEADRLGRFTQIKGSGPCVFGIREAMMGAKRDLLVIVEAEILVMRLAGYGIKAVSSVNGAGNLPPETKRLAAQFQKVIVVGDDDPAGRKFGEARAMTVNGEFRCPPAGYNDLDDWITDGGNPLEFFG